MASGLQVKASRLISAAALFRRTNGKKDTLQDFIIAYNQDFKLVCWLTGKEAGRRLFFKATVHKHAEAPSLTDLGEAGPVDITEENRDALLHVWWKWPKVREWKIPGEYEVKVSVGTLPGTGSQKKPVWRIPYVFSFNVVNPKEVK